MHQTNLEPITPQEALNLYLQEKQTELSDATIYSHNSRLGHFLRWCDERDIDNLNTLTGRDLHRYKLWRRNEGNLRPATVKTQMDTLRVFIRWCEVVDAVTPDLSTKVQSPSLAPGENARDVMLDTEQADAVISHLEKYEYASLPHVTLLLLWHTMMRRGAAHALDVEDYDPNEQLLSVTHRPETDTPIKNGHDGERLVALNGWVCQVLDDWIADQRPDVTDDYGREPLLATAQGRVHYGTIQGYVYAYTRPCVYTGECPHDRTLNTCEATVKKQDASKCPSSVSPHAVRRGAITHWLHRDVPPRVVSDRANVSQAVIDEHYDRRTEREKMEQRRQFLDEV